MEKTSITKSLRPKLAFIQNKNTIKYKIKYKTKRNTKYLNLFNAPVNIFFSFLLFFKGNAKAF